ncbi:MAG: FHA domain-containing protein [Candidatus Riflebacteria bacterium]|nr:FHA domain-containing protein [Candidatus Riflebacteria bacterium]
MPPRFQLNLTIQVPGTEPRVFPVEQDLIRIGTGQECELRIDAPGIQPFHARIDRGATGFVIEAIAPVPGLSVNKGVFKDKVLASGDVVTLGQVTITVSLSVIEAPSMARVERQGQAELKLLIHHPLRGASEHVVIKEVTVVGRSPQCDVRIDDAAVLPQHLSITRTQTGFVMARLPGPSTVSVNGEVMDTKVIYHGDEIRIGRTSIQINSMRRQFKTMADLVYSRRSSAEVDKGTLCDKEEAGEDDEDKGKTAPPSSQKKEDPGIVLDKREAFRSVLGFNVPKEEDHESILKLLENDPGEATSPAAPQGSEGQPDAPAQESAPKPRPTPAGPSPADLAAHMLEVVPVDQSCSWIGGLWNFKNWVANGQRILNQTRGFVAPFPKGITLVGLPGSGKRLAARALALLWGAPLVRLRLELLLAQDTSLWQQVLLSTMTRLSGGPPAILLLSEIDQEIAEAYNRPGISQQLVLDFYGVMASSFKARKNGLFTVFTLCDARWGHQDVLTRGGAVNEVFFFDLPNQRARGEILWVALSLGGMKPDGYDLEKLATVCDAFTGGEILRAVQLAVAAVQKEQRPPTLDELLLSIGQITPQSASATYFVEFADRLRQIAIVA